MTFSFLKPHNVIKLLLALSSALGFQASFWCVAHARLLLLLVFQKPGVLSHPLPCDLTALPVWNAASPLPPLIPPIMSTPYLDFNLTVSEKPTLPSDRPKGSISCSQHLGHWSYHSLYITLPEPVSPLKLWVSRAGSMSDSSLPLAVKNRPGLITNTKCLLERTTICAIMRPAEWGSSVWFAARSQGSPTLGETEGQEALKRQGKQRFLQLLPPKLSLYMTLFPLRLRYLHKSNCCFMKDTGPWECSCISWSVGKPMGKNYG